MKISGKLRIKVVYKCTKGFVDRTSASNSIAIFSVFSNLHRKNSHRFILNAIFMIFGTKLVHPGVQTLKLLSFFLCLVCKSILRILWFLKNRNKYRFSPILAVLIKNCSNWCQINSKTRLASWICYLRKSIFT